MNIEEENFSIKALTNLEDLETESKLMSNCVASQYEDAFLKNLVHFHVKTAINDYTLALVPASYGFYDLRERKNKILPIEELQFIKEKIESHKTKINTFLDLNKKSNEIDFEIDSLLV